MNFRILIVDDETEICLSLSAVLENSGYECAITSDPSTTLTVIAKENIDLVVMDICMPGIEGMDLLKMVKENFPTIPVMMMTGYPSVDSAVTAMKYGATNFYIKPLDISELLKEIKQLSQAMTQPEELLDGQHMVTENFEMKQIIRELEKAAPARAPVLITGESGTGKELAAEALHQHSQNSQAPLLKINCAALPENLLESELFGHEKGAFTGATQQKKGKFEVADGGTLFLDEIGDMSMTTQAKILRVIQEQKFERLGGTHTLETQVRLVAATNKNLQELIQQGLFREDLYYRLSVIGVHLPPIRERAEDVLPLAHYFLNRFNHTYAKAITGFTQEVQQFFCQHAWPGNVREIKNCIERAVIFCDSQQIRLSDLSNQYKELATSQGTQVENYQQSMENLNRQVILEALDKSHGVKQDAARILNINRRTLYNRMKKLGLE